MGSRLLRINQSGFIQIKAILEALLMASETGMSDKDFRKATTEFCKSQLEQLKKDYPKYNK